jgi:hypothetical protein
MQPITDYPNKLSLLISDVVFDVPFFLASTGGTSSASMLFLNSLTNILLCSMMPRFIISVRELYDLDPSRRQQGIDTGFGVSSRIDGQNAAMSAIAFADVTPGQDRAMEGDGNNSEAIRLEVVGGGAGQV